MKRAGRIPGMTVMHSWEWWGDRIFLHGYGTTGGGRSLALTWETELKTHCIIMCLVKMKSHFLWSKSCCRWSCFKGILPNWKHSSWKNFNVINLFTTKTNKFFLISNFFTTFFLNITDCLAFPVAIFSKRRLKNETLTGDLEGVFLTEQDLSCWRYY